jgi:hypothetical protein
MVIYKTTRAYDLFSHYASENLFPGNLYGQCIISHYMATEEETGAQDNSELYSRLDCRGKAAAWMGRAVPSRQETEIKYLLLFNMLRTTVSPKLPQVGSRNEEGHRSTNE